MLPASNGHATPSGSQSPQTRLDVEPPENLQLASRNACDPPLLCVRQTCWNAVNCVSGRALSNVMNCRPVELRDALALGRRS